MQANPEKGHPAFLNELFIALPNTDLNDFLWKVESLAAAYPEILFRIVNGRASGHRAGGIRPFRRKGRAGNRASANAVHACFPLPDVADGQAIPAATEGVHEPAWISARPGNGDARIHHDGGKRQFDGAGDPRVHPRPTNRSDPRRRTRRFQAEHHR